jgi:uncharacterized protein DUF1549/uncharacterized protein DUF1553/cytochrome c
MDAGRRSQPLSAGKQDGAHSQMRGKPLYPVPFSLSVSFRVLRGLFLFAVPFLLCVLCASVAAFAAAPGPGAPTVEAVAFFESRIRPLLHDRCFGCHGEKVRQGGLRLDSRAALLKGGDTGPVLTPGDPERSALIRVVRYEGRVKMPPAGKLKADEIAALEEWVRQGAVWPSASGRSGVQASGRSGTDPPKPGANSRPWAFKPVQRPALPTVKNRGWAKSPVDAFILAKLEAKGLRPAPYASRRTLIRRAYFDLIGLPPPPEEVEAFVSDRSPDAWAKVVDRLLASPQFGERWARHWLDVVRYTDSFDSRILGDQNPGRTMDITEAWRYRDWVAEAFNRDLPYDDFVRYQIAGDLLPPLPWPMAERKETPGVVATGMLALGNWGGGDADKEKLLTDIVDDQIDVTSRAFTGLTVACARCHDHKFDPISTKDYYALAGIFFSTHILENVGPKTNGPPMLRIPLATPAEVEARRLHTERIAETEKRLTAARSEAYASLARALVPQTSRYLVAAWEYGRAPAAASLPEFARARGLHPHALRGWVDYLGMGDYRLMTVPVRNVHGIAGVHAFRGEPDCPSLTVNSTENEVSILTFKLPPRSLSVHPGPSSGVVLAWRSPIAGTVRISGGVRDGDPVSGDGIAWILDHRGGAAVELASGAIENGGMQGLEAGKDGARLSSVQVSRGDEIQLLVLPKNGHGWDTTTVRLVISEVNGTRTWDAARDLVPDLHVGGKGNPHPDSYGTEGVWRFYDMANSSRAGTAPGDPALAAWSRAARAAGEDRVAVERAAEEFGRSFTLADAKSPFWIRSEADEAALPEAARANLARLAADLKALREAPLPPLTFVNGAREGGVPGSPKAGFADAPVHLRGRYDRLGETVPRGFPAVLAAAPGKPVREGSGRKELADWLADPRHPLTARVMANRVWGWLFGEGIVRSAGNFGKLGEPPSHPELLDWLAGYFVAGDRGQGSGVGEKPVSSPTPNPHPPTPSGAWSVKRLVRLLMHSAAYQQDSRPRPETLRADPDNRLFGRMSRRRLEAEAIRDSLLAVSGSLDRTPGGRATGDIASPRRTLYLMTVRSNKEGFRFLFDAANPDTSVDKRVTSTVAPQALFMLNHPFALEQTRRLAKRVWEGAGADDRAGVRNAYQLLFGRPPSAEEEGIGLRFLEQARGSGTGESAGQRAWEEYCQLLLCTNEFVYLD